MALYYYKKKINNFKTQTISLISYFSLFFGIGLIFWAVYPIISFELYQRLIFSKRVIDPAVTSENNFYQKEYGEVMGKFDFFSNNLRDFLQVNQWFPTAQASFSNNKISVSSYYLSIPKLNIKDALVIVNGEDLQKSLIQFQAQSLPGEYGNVVIFGHSTLPVLFNPKDYKTIFTYLPSLERGDKVIIRLDKAEYEYVVYDMFVVEPSEVSVLNQMKDGVYLTLITCVPPGTYWKRLVVRAKLASLK